MASEKSVEVLTSEAAKILGVTASMVQYLEKSGQLPAKRVGHIRVFARADVERLQRERYRKQTRQPHWQLDKDL